MRPQHCVQGELACEQLELTDLKSVEAFAERAQQESSIDYLLLNAGIAFIPKQYTQDGFERQLASNHIGHFYLTQLLTGKLKSQAGCCVPLAVHHEQLVIAVALFSLTGKGLDYRGQGNADCFF